MSEVELTREWLVMAHTIEYDPTWPDGKPNYCAECDEALPDGNERCGHNAALLALVDRAATLARLAAADRDTALRERVETLRDEWGARWDVPEVGVLDMAAKHYRDAAAQLSAALDQTRAGGSDS